MLRVWTHGSVRLRIGVIRRATGARSNAFCRWCRVARRSVPATRNVKLFDARNLRKSFQASCVKVGLGVETGPKVWQYNGLLLHDLRRSGVRNLIRSGVPRRIAMKISGHLTESTFERYNIVDSTDLHEAMAKVEKYFDGNLMAVE